MSDLAGLPYAIKKLRVAADFPQVRDNDFLTSTIQDAIAFLSNKADLAPVIGYTEQQMREAMIQCVVSDDKIDEILEALIPAAEVVPASSVLVPTIDELAEAMYQNNTALLTNVEARYIAKVVHALLTKGRGGV